MPNMGKVNIEIYNILLIGAVNFVTKSIVSCKIHATITIKFTNMKIKSNSTTMNLR